MLLNSIMLLVVFVQLFVLWSDYRNVKAYEQNKQASTFIYRSKYAYYLRYTNKHNVICFCKYTEMRFRLESGGTLYLIVDVDVS